MPNWCSNKIVILGDDEKIADILKKIESSEEFKVFETLIGYHPIMTKDNWYEANVEWFGTKWDVDKDELDVDSSEDQLTINPQTAWSPPIPFCKTLAEKYGVEVKITYFEPGADIAGLFNFNENGEVVEEEVYDYNEGMYILDRDGFWSDQENGYIDDEDINIDEYIGNKYSFINDEDIPKLKEIIEKLKEEAGE